jgi:hypothetical protein
MFNIDSAVSSKIFNAEHMLAKAVIDPSDIT